ncbi:MAG: extracellular solute-binding protein [Pseudomonadota bacterium]
MQKLMTTTILSLTLGALPAFAEVTISHGYSTFGDLKYPADFTHFDYANPDAPQGGTITQRQLFGTPTFDSLNPFIIKGDGAPEVQYQIYDSLMASSYDEPDASYGLIAETIEYPADLSYVFFNMRPEARFHDGEPITADDVVFTFNAFKTEGHPFYQNLFADVVDIVAESDLRVRFDLAEGAGASLPGDIGGLPILPAHFYDDVPFDESWMTIPLGSGPYELVDVDAPRTLRFCKTDDYWAADLPVNAGRNNFECYVYEYFVDDTVGLEAFAAGEYHMRVEYRSSNWATGYDFPAAQAGQVQQILIPDGRPANAQGIWFNMRKPMLQDIRVRQALEYAFNFAWTNEVIFYDTYTRTDSFFENTEMEATGLPEGAELALLEEFRDQLRPEVFTDPVHSPNEGGPRPTHRPDMRAANALLEEAGWVVGDDGVRRNAEGEAMRLEFPDSSRSLDRIMIPYTENLQALGIDVEFEVLDPSSWTQRRQAFDFDLSSTAWAVSSTPGSVLRAFYGSAAADAEGSNNLTGLADPVVDALIERAVQAETREELNVTIRALDRVLRSKHIWIGGWNLGAHRVAVWDIFGRPETPALYDFNRGVDFWWFEQEKYDALVAEGALEEGL